MVPPASAPRKPPAGSTTGRGKASPSFPPRSVGGRKEVGPTATTCWKRDAWCGAAARPSSSPTPSCSTVTSVSERPAYTFPMGSLATSQALIARWSELCRDSSLNDLPYKVELNARGKLELTPRTNRRGLLTASLACDLHQQLP